MGEKEIREKYGGKLPKAINRAIRAEFPEGNAALDTLTKLAGPAAYSGWNLPDGKATDEAKRYHKHKTEIVDKLEYQIRKKWGLPPAEVEESKSKAKRKKSIKGTRKPARSKRGDPKSAGRLRQNG